MEYRIKTLKACSFDKLQAFLIINYLRLYLSHVTAGFLSFIYYLASFSLRYAFNSAISGASC